MKLEDWRKKDILDGFQFLGIEVNEAMRSYTIIGTIVLHVCKQDPTYRYLIQNIDNGIITDFEVFKNGKLIHILEVKGHVKKPSMIEQLKKYLETRSCKRGCLTDGYLWQFYLLENGELIKNGDVLFSKLQLDEIVEKIVQDF